MRNHRGFLFATWVAMLVSSPATAQLVEQPPLCYTGTSPDECACIRRFNYTQSDGNVVTLSMTRSLSYPQTVPTWQVQTLPTNSAMGGITDSDFQTIWNDCIREWAFGSFLIPQDMAQTGVATPSGDWQLRWLSTDALRSLPNVSSVGIAATRISAVGNGTSFWLAASTIYIAYDPWLYDQYGNKQYFTWNQYFTTPPFNMSMRSVVSHEFGHSLGFDDFHSPNPLRAVMYNNIADQDHKNYASSCEQYAASHAYNDASVDAVVENFRVVNDAGGVRVSWHASSEYDMLGYLVERAPNRFGPFAAVATVPTDASHDYSLLDSGHSDGVWRLRQLTANGDTLTDAADTISVVSNTPPPAPEYTEEQTAALMTAQSQMFPESIQPVGPEWSDWVAIVPDGWVAAAQPLADYWNTHGHKAWVSSFADAGGVGNIHNFLAAAASYGYLRDVLLVGDANDYAYWSDNALWINGWVRPTWPTQAQYNILPMGEYVVDTRPPLTGTSIGGWTPFWSSDWAYVDFDGDHRPDLDIGRVPVRSASELTLYVQKALNVLAEPTGGVRLNHVGIWTYARDKRYAEGAIAAEVGQDAISAVPANRVVDVLWDDDTSLMTQDQREALARSAMESGRGLIAVNGSASSEANWCDWWVQHEFSWAGRTAGNWPVQPFLLGAACGIAAVDLTEDPWPKGTSGAYSSTPMIEQALTDPTRGPFGCFGPTRAGPQEGHHALERAFLDALFLDNQTTAGGAARDAIQRVMTQTPTYGDLARSYILIGDPLMPIRTTVAAPTVAISGETVLSKTEVGTWTAYGSGGDGTYAYTWYRRTSPPNAWIYVGTGPTYSYTMGVNDFEIRCDVASAGATGTAVTCIVYSGSPTTITASISGSSSVACGTATTYTAYASGGRICREYGYQWRLSYDGGTTWGPVVGTASSLTLTPTANFVLSLTVSRTDGSPPTTTVTASVNVTGTPCTGGGGGGGGCPIADTRTITGWAVENSLLGRTLDGTSLTDFYRLKVRPLDADGHYQLRIRENEQERTTLEAARLLVVDHPTGTIVRALGDRIVAGTFVPAERVTRRDGTDITAAVMNPDGPAFIGKPGEILTVTPPSDHRLRGVFTSQVVIKEMEGQVPLRGAGSADLTPDARILGSTGLSFQAADDQGAWMSLARRYPRENLDDTAVEDGGDGPMRISFTGRHGVRSPGWITPITEGVRIQEVRLEVAEHSRLGDVLARLGSSGPPVTLQAADTLTLSFRSVPAPEGQVRDFFLVTTGRYTSNLAEGQETAGSDAPVRFALHQNEPNPFSGSTRIRLDLPRDAQVRLAIYDLQGRLIRVLADGRMTAGRQALEWDQRDHVGQRVTPGVYLYRMNAEGFTRTRRMVVLPGRGLR